MKVSVLQKNINVICVGVEVVVMEIVGFFERKKDSQTKRAR